MNQINYANSMQGKLFSLAHGKGSLSGMFINESKYWPLPKPGYPPIPPPGPIDTGIDRQALIFNNNRIDQCIQWSFVKLIDEKFMLTCSSPLTGKTHVMTCSQLRDVGSIINANNFDLPTEVDKVDNGNLFTITYIDQSPCFFYIKNAYNLYLATREESIDVLGQKLGIPTFFTEDQKNDPAINANCVWFIDTVVDKIRQTADSVIFIDDRDVKCPISFTDISSKVNKTIDKAYLDELMGK